MSRQASVSKPIKTHKKQLERFEAGMSARDIQIVTGWSRATVYRRMKDPEFPRPQSSEGNPTWDTMSFLEWLSRHNLMVILGRKDFLDYERNLQAKSFADPRLRSTLGRIVERENERRARLRDGPYAEMLLESK